MTEIIAPSLPIYVTVPIWVAVLTLILFQISRLRDAYVAFLLCSLWLRYALGAFHEYTYLPVLYGFSSIALSSVIVIAAGFVLLGTQALWLRKLAAFYVIILLVLLSAAINQSWVGAINATLKWLYMIVFTLIAYASIERNGPDRVFRVLAVVFTGPIVLQWISVAWGLDLINEDRTLSFVGGYQHEQAFSIILLTFLYITVFVSRLGVIASYLRLLIVAAGLAYANYRTTILAATAPAVSFAITTVIGRITPRQRIFVFIVVGAATVASLIEIANLAYARFADLGEVLDKGASLIQSPEYFTADQRRLFSGRVYLWSQYFNAYLDGNIIQLLFGFGPESWVGRFPLYAHNTFVSHLYELGMFGLAAFVWLLLVNMLRAIYTGSAKIILVSCHVGFFVLNLATMPIWAIEGDILYAFLLAQTWYMQALASRKSQLSKARIASTSLAYG
jgi:hypothetical protein